MANERFAAHISSSSTEPTTCGNAAPPCSSAAVSPTQPSRANAVYASRKPAGVCTLPSISVAPSTIAGSVQRREQVAADGGGALQHIVVGLGLAEHVAEDEADVVEHQFRSGFPVRSICSARSSVGSVCRSPITASRSRS